MRGSKFLEEFLMKVTSLRGNPLLKFLDRYAGIPLVFILGIFRSGKRRKPAAGEIKNAAFLLTAAIGDTVLLSAAIRDFKLRLPGSRLTFFAGSDNFEIAKHIGGIDHLVLVNPARPFGAVKTIRAEGEFDVWFDFGSWARLNSVFTFFSAAGYKVGFRTRGQYRHYIYDNCEEHSDSDHECENYKKLLRLLDIAGNSFPNLLTEGRPEKNTDNVVVHMFPGGSRAYLKEWDEENWIRLIDNITGLNCRVYLTGAGKDREKALNIFQRVRARDRVIVAAGEYNLGQTIDLIASAELVVTIDTGILHIASALKTNLIALHGPTSAGRWGALNKNSVSFEPRLGCSPCISLGFESRCKNNRCMREISVENVMDAVIKFISDKRRI